MDYFKAFQYDCFSNYSAKKYFSTNDFSEKEWQSLDERKKQHSAFINQGVSKPIELETYRLGLTNMLVKTGAGYEEAFSFANEKIEKSIMLSAKKYNAGATNSFFAEARNRGLEIGTVNEDIETESLDEKEIESEYKKINIRHMDDYLNL